MEVSILISQEQVLQIGQDFLHQSLFQEITVNKNVKFLKYYKSKEEAQVEMIDYQILKRPSTKSKPIKTATELLKTKNILNLTLITYVNI